ncbi:MAG: glycosyltransferase [PVC group bacterium]
MVIPRLQSGGAERQLGYLSHGLAELNYEVLVVTLGDKGDPPPGWSRHVSLHRLKGRSNYDPRLIFQLYRLIRRVRPDIIQTWNPQTDIMGGIAAVLNAGRWIIRESNAGDSYRYGWKAKLRALIGTKANAVVSNSAGGDDYWRSLYPDKLRSVISNSLPFEEIDRVRPIGRQELGLEEDQGFVLYAGRLTRQKRVERIVNAIAALDPESRTIAFICGEGEDLNELQALARRRGVEGRVKFCGFLKTETIWGMMKSADLLINLSDYEGMPNTVMEAMACGCPLLVSDIPAHREILDGNTAILADPRDTAAQAKALRDLLADPESARSRAAAAEKRTRSWSIGETARKYDQMYRELISMKIREP